MGDPPALQLGRGALYGPQPRSRGPCPSGESKWSRWAGPPAPSPPQPCPGPRGAKGRDRTSALAAFLAHAGPIITGLFKPVSLAL